MDSHCHKTTARHVKAMPQPRQQVLRKSRHLWMCSGSPNGSPFLNTYRRQRAVGLRASGGSWCTSTTPLKQGEEGQARHCNSQEARGSGSDSACACDPALLLQPPSALCQLEAPCRPPPPAEPHLTRLVSAARAPDSPNSGSTSLSGGASSSCTSRSWVHGCSWEEQAAWHAKYGTTREHLQAAQCSN